MAARWDFQPKHPSYSNVGHFMWCDGRVARERKILTEYGIENPRVSGSIPLQATIFIGFVAENVLQISIART